MRRPSSIALLALTLVAAGGVAGCQGCHAPSPDAPRAGQPTVRLYLTSNLAGALEPCGCTKDQLGGIQHFASWMRAQSSVAPASLFIGAGPMLYLEPTLRSGDSSQDTWKAEAIAGAFKSLGLAAWSPGYNDWAGGAEGLARCREISGATLLAGNVPGLTATLLREVGGVKIGLVGVADPRDRMGSYPKGVSATAALDAMKSGLAEVKKQGARVLVGLAALPRGEALRIADSVPELHVLVVGKPMEAGDANDAAKAPVLAGNTLVVESANHLQSVGVVDLFVRSSKDPLVFADAGGVARADAMLGLASRIRDLETRINSWELDKQVKAEDLAARKAELDKLRKEKARIEGQQLEVHGSFFRYSMVEVRDKMGKDAAVYQAMTGYYKRVNEHNKVAYADRKPAEPEPGKPRYIGLEACSECHEEERRVWDKTKHATAYRTLVQDFKEFNLECVSCHVTGYDKPGGSTVTHNDKLRDVQCETCHGPGSLHAKDPENKALYVAKPDLGICLGCHHPPHVDVFDPQDKVKQILGPGHGLPSDKPPGDKKPPENKPIGDKPPEKK